MNSIELKKYLKSRFNSTSSFRCGFALGIVDFFTLTLCLGLGFFLVNLFAMNDINFKSFVNYCIFFPFIFLLFAFFGLYPGIMISSAEEMRRFSGATLISFVMIASLVIFSNAGPTHFLEKIVASSQTRQIIIAFIIAFILAAILLTANRELAKIQFSRFKWWGVPCVIYCNGKSCEEIVDKLLKNKNLGYHPAVIIDSSFTDTNGEQKYYKGIPVFSSKNTEIIKVIHEVNIKTAILCDFQDDTSPIMTKYRYTISVSIRQTSFTTTQQIKDIAGLIGFASTHNLTFGINLAIKRLFDIFMILLFSPILIPVFLILIILVKITSKGPAFYGHPRVGKNGKVFKCWKFRSMNINSQEMLKEILENDPVRREEWERERKFSDDPRVTKFGKFLRKTSLDELPQLINIFLGQMSFVGPRPVTQEETELYGSHKDLVLSVTPGLSGLWQISGRSETTYDERIFFDTFYIQNWSIWLDLWIIIKSVWVVLSRKGAY